MGNPLVANAMAAGFAALAKDEHSTARAAFEFALSEGGCNEALIHLAWLLEQGLGGERDISQAIRLYRAALDTRSADLAAFHLGLLLMKQGSSGRRGHALAESRRFR